MLRGYKDSLNMRRSNIATLKKHKNFITIMEIPLLVKMISIDLSNDLLRNKQHLEEQHALHLLFQNI